MTPADQHAMGEHAIAHADILVLFGPDSGKIEGVSAGALSFHVTNTDELDRLMRDAFAHTGKRVLLAFDKRVPEAERDAAKGVMEARHHSARMSRNTLENKMVLQGTNVLQNLSRLERHGFASSLGQPLAGYPVFVVGAGPSLEKNRHLLERARDKGAVVCVNTATGAVPCDVDAVIAVEALDVSQHIRNCPRDTTYILDLHTHPNTWDAAEACGRIVTTIPLDPPVNWLALRLGCIPFSSGCAAATMLVSTLRWWGASEIIFVGMDLAWTPEGGVYAQGSAYDDLKVTRDGDQMKFAGESKYIVDQHVCEVTAYGGEGIVNTSFAMEGQIAWFAEAAPHIRMTNATEGGARIPGTIEKPLQEVLDALPDKPRPVLGVPPAVPEWAGAWAHIYDTARELSGGGYPLSESQRRLPLISFWMLPELMRLQNGPPNDPVEYHDAVTAAIVRSAKEIVRVMEETR